MFFGGRDSDSDIDEPDGPPDLVSDSDDGLPPRKRPRSGASSGAAAAAATPAAAGAGAAAAAATPAARPLATATAAEAAAAAAAGNDFRKHLLSGWRAGRASAKTTCTTAYFATVAGACGVEDFAVAPTDHNSNHARTLQRACSIDVSTNCYHTQIPMWDPTSNSKIKPCIPFRPPFAAFADDFAKHPERYKATSNEATSDWRELFVNHEVCKRYGVRNCFPVGFYADEVPYQTSQGPLVHHDVRKSPKQPA